MTPAALETERLLLRRWRPEDRDPSAALNADPAVMEFFPSTLSRAESDALADRIEAEFVEHGFGLWAVEVKGGIGFAGFVGLTPKTFEAHFTPAVEVGWRLAHTCWGQGFAPEGALAAVADGFERVGLTEIVSMTAVVNQRSQRVMTKIGMTRDPADDFDYPTLPATSPLSRHVLYRIRPER